MMFFALPSCRVKVARTMTADVLQVRSRAGSQSLAEVSNGEGKNETNGGRLL
jgi:hypothetical protein